jgi:hypothetical protein
VTGPNSYGQHPTDPRQRQPGTWPPVAPGPTQPGTWPPVAAGPTQTQRQAHQGTPELISTPPRRRRRRPLLIGAVVVAVIATVCTVLAVRHWSKDSSVPTIKVTEPLKREYFMPEDPAGALATAAELKEITQIDLATNGAKPVTAAEPDHATVPSGCAAAMSPNSTYVVGDSSQIVGQQFADTSGNTAWVGLAFWDKQEDAWMSTAKLGAVLTMSPCSHFVVTGAPGVASSTWNITDAKASLDHSSWTATREGGEKPLKCYNHYFVNANVGAMASLCTANQSADTAKKIDELMMDKATTKH